MIYLLIVSLIWAFSFGLIKDNLTSLDSNFVAFTRLLISFFVFIPFLKIKKIKNDLVFKLIFNGAIQYGIMYVAYIYAFQFLKAYEIVLFTIFTPIYVTLINDILNKKFNRIFLITSSLAVIGAGIIVYDKFSYSNLIVGFILIQVSNLSFAFGQVFYKNIMAQVKIRDRDVFALLYFGAILTSFIFTLFTTNLMEIKITETQVFTLLYLGIVASGLGFFLWNYGARKTNAGALAIFNNLKIPLGILVSILFFDEIVNINTLIIGGIIVIFALIINEHYIRKKPIINNLE